MQQLNNDIKSFLEELDKELNNEERNQEKVDQLNTKLRDTYAKIMSSPAMVEYNTAKAELDQLIGEVNTVISKSLDGEDPETCETVACTGSCSTCGGCH